MPESVTLVLSQTNCFLIRLKQGFLLVDCGRRQDKSKLLRELARHGLSPADLTFLFLTHHHNDHSGLLDFLVTVNPAIRVIMSRQCARALATGSHDRHPHERYAAAALKLLVGARLKLDRHWSPTFSPYHGRRQDIIVEADNDTILPQIGLTGKVLLTPGHTPDSISLVCGRTAFVGDAARGILNFAGKPYFPIILYDYGICWQSWQKIASAGAEQVFPAHGKPFHISKLF